MYHHHRYPQPFIPATFTYTALAAKQEKEAEIREIAPWAEHEPKKDDAPPEVPQVLIIIFVLKSRDHV